MEIWVVGTSNQLFRRGFYTKRKFSKKIKQLSAKFCSQCQVHSVLSILFVLTLASDKTVLYGNVAFSILVFSAKKEYSSFLKKVFVFQKICFKVKVFKTFKISSDCHITGADPDFFKREGRSMSATMVGRLRKFQVSDGLKRPK